MVTLIYYLSMTVIFVTFLGIGLCVGFRTFEYFGG
jgi:hypothetical protein